MFIKYSYCTHFIKNTDLMCNWPSCLRSNHMFMRSLNFSHFEYINTLKFWGKWANFYVIQLFCRYCMMPVVFFYSLKLLLTSLWLLHLKCWHKMLNYSLNNTSSFLEMINPSIDFLILLCTQSIVIHDYSKQDVNFEP